MLAQLTGDLSVVDRFGAKVTHVPDPPERAGVTDPDTADELASAVIDALADPRREAVNIDDLEFFSKLLPVALGSDVDERAGAAPVGAERFSPSQPTLPRTVPIPDTMSVAIIGAGIAGINAALAAAEAGVSYEIFDRNAEVGGTWLTTTYPGIGVDTPSAYYSLSREVNPDWTNYYPQGAEYQAYLVALADKHRLRDHTRFDTEVAGAVVGRGPQALADPHGGRRRQPRHQPCPGGHRRRRLSQSAALARTCRGGKPSQASVFTPRCGIPNWISPASESRSSEPAAPPCRSWTPASRGRAPHGIPAPAPLGRAT